MCIGIFKPANILLKKSVLENCYRANGQGAGFAFCQDGKVIIHKGMFKFEDFWNQLDTVQTAVESPMLVHFRIATSGEVDDVNCHPWRIDDQHALIHNGSLYDFLNSTSKISDTGLFVHNIIKPLFEQFPDFYKTKFGHYLIEEAIGYGNKLVILSADGSSVIFNESAGERYEGAWYSNKSYLPPKKKEKKPKEKKPKRYFACQEIKIEDDLIIKEGQVLTIQNISKLTHHFHCKLVKLVEKGIIEGVPEAEFPEEGTEAYAHFCNKMSKVS